MNEIKKLINQIDLYATVFDYIKPGLDNHKYLGKYWSFGTREDAFDLALSEGVGYRHHIIGACLIDNYWEIYNNYHVDKNVNIKVFNARVEFIEDSEFKDFNKEYMYKLYLIIKEVVEGANIKEENNNE